MTRTGNLDTPDRLTHSISALLLFLRDSDNTGFCERLGKGFDVIKVVTGRSSCSLDIAPIPTSKQSEGDMLETFTY